MFMVWYERKVVVGHAEPDRPEQGRVRSACCRHSPTASRLFFKEDLLPTARDRFVFRLAPFLAFVPAFLVWAVIPLGGDFSDGR